MMDEWVVLVQCLPRKGHFQRFPKRLRFLKEEPLVKHLTAAL